MTPGKSIYIGRWRIDVGVRADAAPLPRGISATGLARSVGAALDAAGADAPASIGLTLSTDAELATLNERHLGEKGPTDVLSFPLLPPHAFPAHPHAAGGGGLRPGSSGTAGSIPAFALPPGGRLHLGDIVISVERAIEQARSGRGGQTGNVSWSAGDELRLLVTHGALHVCGWDHAEPVEEAAMRALERRLLEGAALPQRPRP